MVLDVPQAAKIGRTLRKVPHVPVSLVIRVRSCCLVSANNVAGQHFVKTTSIVVPLPLVPKTEWRQRKWGEPIGLPKMNQP